MSLPNDALSDTLSLLSVRTPVTRRDGGVEELEETTTNRESLAASGGQERTGGTSSYVLNSVLGQPARTVESEEVGTTFPVQQVTMGSTWGDTDANLPTGINRKFKLFCAPVDPEELGQICKKAIGQGAAFCLVTGCRVSHHGEDIRVNPGALHVMKSPTTAFVDPSLPPGILEPDLLAQWRNQSSTLDEWCRLFVLASSSSSKEEPASKATLEAEELFATRAEAFRTPATKRKRRPVEFANALNLSPYVRVLTEGEALGDPLRSTSESEPRVGEVLRELDLGLETTSAALLSLMNTLGQESSTVSASLQALEYQIEMVGKGLGAKPAGLAEDVMAPTAWATIATVADKLSLLQKGSLQRNNVETMINESKQKLIQYIEVLLNQQKRSIDSDVANGNSGIKTLQVFVKESTLRLNEKLDVEVQDLHAKLENLGKRPRSDDPTEEGPKLKRQAGRTPTGAHDAGDCRTERPDWASEVIATFEGRVNGLENKVQKISADSDETAIKFAGLGFRSQKETAAWCEIAIPHHNCGLIVDAHMVLEHVNAAIEGQETIHRLEKLSRLKIKTIADGLAMTSFETKLPRYFSAPGPHKIIRSDASYFNKLPNHEDWDSPSTGFRDRLKEELTEFKAAHSEHIGGCLDPESRAYAVAMLALADSVAWIEGFIVFLDDYYKELTKAKFGSKKAWHVTTRIGRRMFTEIAVPRNGVQMAFQAGQNAQITQKVAWSVFKSHDIMARYKRNAYKDDPTVASELVKFLAINTGIEAIDRVVTKVEVMEGEVTTAKREATTASRAASTASNKIDELKKVVDALAKRVGRTLPAIPDGLKAEELPRSVPGSAPAARAEEGGWLKLALPQSFALIFESQPVWLYALEREQVRKVTLGDFDGPASLQRWLTEKNIDPRLAVRSLRYLGSQRVEYVGPGSTVPSESTVLASGSQEFLRATWRANKGNPMFLLTDSHWPYKTISCKRIPWFRLRHAGFGGTTNYVALLGLPNVQLNPLTTTLRRNIGHILDHSIRPNNWSTAKASSCPDPMTTQSRLDINHLSREVLYQTHQTASGWGLRALTPDEVGIAFGLPAFQRLGGLTMSSFPLVPVQIMDGILKAYGRRESHQAPLRPPIPDPAVADEKQSWLPSVQRFLSHDWIDPSLVTAKAAKADDAGIQKSMWDARSTLLFPWAVHVLAFLRSRLMVLLQRKLYLELKVHLQSEHGHDWLQRLLAARRKIAAPVTLRGGRKRTWGGKTGKETSQILQELLADTTAGIDVLNKFSNATWWSWTGGSTLVFWRWPAGMQRKAARDGMRAWIKEALPKHKHAAKRPKSEQFAKYLPKLQKILERGYVVPSGHIKSLTDYFDVPKDDDIRLVYNGTSCGLNGSLWAPNFWLPTAKSAIRVLGFGYFSVDIDLGEMFLNFPLPAILREYSGVDLSPFREALEEILKVKLPARFWVQWVRCWMGLRPSPYMAIRFYYWAEEFARGNPRDKKNHLRWDKVVLNLPGDSSFDPAMPLVYKWDAIAKGIAGDLVAFVDDLRASGYSREHAWAIARQVTSRMQYLGIQDAPRKRRPPDTHPGAWAGAILTAKPDSVTKSVSQAKWDKAKKQVSDLIEEANGDANYEYFYNWLEKVRGFLCHLSMTFEMMVPFLKGFHLTLAKHNKGRADDGWKLTNREWEAWLGNSVETGRMTEEEAAAARHPETEEGRKPPLRVHGVERFADDLNALSSLLSAESPPEIVARSRVVLTLLYGFADASGTGFGSTILGPGGVRYRIGTWGPDEEGKSSNFREFENVVCALEEEARRGNLKGALVYLFTDNSTVEAALYKGTSSSRLLFALVVRLRKLEMEQDATIKVSHVSGKRMEAQGTDGVSRGHLKEGISTGMSMLSFVPMNKSCIQQSSELLPWIKLWAGNDLEVLEPKDWFERGHDLLGGEYDKAGFWRYKTKPGTFLWVPPPAAADVALEELRKARLKRQDSLHIVAVPRLTTPDWLKQLYKASDVVFEIPAGSVGWPAHLYEPLTVGLLFPFLSSPPWQIRATPKMFYVARELRRLFDEAELGARDFLRKLLLECRELRTMPQDVVWRMLYFLGKSKVPGSGAGGWAGRKRKRPMEPGSTREGLGEKASAPGRFPKG